jgi:hypothetical protein
MATAVCETLRIAKEPVTRENIIKFLRSLPRKQHELITPEWQNSYCSLCLEKAYVSLEEPDKGWIVDYFIRYFPERWWMCQETMIDGFIGLLDGILWEAFQCPTND